MDSIIWGFFITHAAIYLIANIFLLIINLVGNPFVFWFIWPFLIWTLILAGHYQLNKLVLSGYFAQQKIKIIKWLSQL